MKVLVVDDQPDVVRGILDGVNWSRLKIESAFGANSAAEAREILKREQIDILLCDIEMPGESGLHLVSWLREQGQSVKCIFLTAHADFAYAQSALKLEAADYLLQPASYAAIEGAILHAVERLQQERLAQLYSTMGRGAAQEALGFRRSILREFLLGIRGGAQEAAEKASAFGFSCMPETLCRCVWVQIQHWEGEPMEYGLLLYGFQNVLEELLAPMSRQTTVLSLGGDAYLILLDADESGGAYDALCSSLESFHSFAKQELHLGLTCLLGRSAVPFRELPAEYLRLQEAHRNNVARTCGVLPLESGAAPPDVEPDFAKWQSLLDEGCGKAVREEIHAYFDRLSRQGALNREVLSAFHESFLELFFGVLQQRRDRVREVFNDTFDYDAMLHACSTLPQLLEFVDFATDYAEARQGCRQAQGRAQNFELHPQEPAPQHRPRRNCKGCVPEPRVPLPPVQKGNGHRAERLPRAGAHENRAVSFEKHLIFNQHRRLQGRLHQLFALRKSLQKGVRHVALRIPKGLRERGKMTQKVTFGTA